MGTSEQKNEPKFLMVWPLCRCAQTPDLSTFLDDTPLLSTIRCLRPFSCSLFCPVPCNTPPHTHTQPLPSPVHASLGFLQPPAPPLLLVCCFFCASDLEQRGLDGSCQPLLMCGVSPSFVPGLRDRRMGGNHLVSQHRALRNILQQLPRHLLFQGGSLPSRGGRLQPIFTFCCWKENVCLLVCPSG